MGIQTYLIKPIRRRRSLQSAGPGTRRRWGNFVARVNKPQHRAIATKSIRLSGSDVFDEARALKVLVVDDSRDNLLLVHAYFKNLPYVIEDAENGEVAVEKFKTGTYDVVLMDIEMPVMDGYTATRAIRAIER